MKRCPTCGTELLFEVTALDPVCKLMQSRINHLEVSGCSYEHVRKLKSFLSHHIGPFMGDRDVKAVSSKVVFDFYTALLQRGLASKTIKHILDALKGLFSQLYNLEVITKLPAFPKVKVKPQPKRWIDTETQLSILGNLPDKYKLYVQILFETGMRPGEARALRRRDIAGSVITVERALDEANNLRPTKTGKIYKYQISEALSQYIEINYRNYLPEADMFKLSKTRIQVTWQKACQAVGVTIPLYQATRHSKASQINAQCELDRLCKVKEALQHESAATTTKHYVLGQKEKI
ncbi:MAG: site-specific integrase [Nitrospirae bacterium]|nr:site-specific integrase [Nitrospirota bacterium]